MNNNYIFPEDIGKEQQELISDLEIRIIKLIASGKSASEIAGELSLSVATLGVYRSHLLEKMNMRNNAELALYALNHHLV